MNTVKPGAEKVDVLICGGGPVGLFMGCMLAETEISFCVLESGTEPVMHSRSIGIHPPSIELFGKIGLGEQLMSRGVRISRGVAHNDHGELGTLDFGILPPPHRYVLTVPQYETEALLEERLVRRRRLALQRGVTLNSFHTDGRIVHAYATDVSGKERVFEAGYLVGCDGKNSLVRATAGIPFRGGPYPDTYVMGDFPEHSADRYTAGIWLHSRGLVESFPLTGGLRRWVVKTDAFAENGVAEMVCSLTEKRTGVRLKPGSATMTSAFGVQRYLAGTMRTGNILLAGDAAHVVSPIGGQGMNLGWMDAAELAAVLPDVIRGLAKPSVFDEYSRKRLASARSAIRRAEFNMAMGRKTRLPALRGFFARTMLRRPFNRLMAGLFTMRWL
jgi:2-polyprenyl-6-methoxyphenol hydroxylase-like FAD-dependent oxidoreductase